MPSVVSLFSGCGGLDLGFKDEGFDLLYASDNDPAAVRCYARNLEDRVHLRDVSGAQFHSDIRSLGRCDVVLGGFPCQGFSKAGPKVRDDPRNTLYIEMRRAVEHLRPVVFVAENVDGMTQNFGGTFVTRIKADFARIGYDVRTRILQAAGYGVPQYRRRIIFVGVRMDALFEFEWPEPTHAAPDRNGEFTVALPDDAPLDDAPLFGKFKAALPPARTIADAIPDLVELDPRVPDHRVTGNWPESYRHIFKAIGPGQKLCNVRHAASSVYTWEIPEVFGATTRRQRLILETISKHRRHKRYGKIPNGNPLSPAVIESLSGLKDISPDLGELVDKKYLKEKEGKFDLLGAMFCSGLFKRPLWAEPAPTVLTVFDNPRYFLHPLKDRPFSVRECARLQGFPDTFRFCDGDSRDELKDAYRLIGNAVPPPLARRLAQAVKRAFASGTAPTKGPGNANETADAQTAA